MKEDWTTFARTGTPGGQWPRFTRSGQRMMSLMPTGPEVETDYAAEHRCAFWAAVI